MLRLEAAWCIAALQCSRDFASRPLAADVVKQTTEVSGTYFLEIYV